MTLESSRHLYQPPHYIANKIWTNNFQKALSLTSEEIHLDMAGIYSFLSFGYVSNDRTLIEEIKRQPWLSQINENSEVLLEPIPEHGFYTGSNDYLAKELFQRLLTEAKEVTKEFDKVYVLLSGGLDSRIVAGVLKYLFDRGELKSKPIAVTWGLEDSRDVVYARKLAEILDFSWEHAPMSPENLLENIYATTRELGLIHSPELLHNMLWLKKLPENSVVLAGSFGDSIGRAEFSGKHLLLTDNPQPKERYHLLKDEVAIAAGKIVKSDIQELFERAPQASHYVHNEHFQQGLRMRNGLCNALSIINGEKRKLYQMFTAPYVFEFMWSLHPSRRDDEIYRVLLENHLPELARFPWARTNKALGGATIGSITGLRENYHDYTNWMRQDINKELEELIDLEWFGKFEIFDIESIKKLREVVRNSETRVGRANDIWIWLAGFRVFINELEEKGKKIFIHEKFDKPLIGQRKNSPENILRDTVLSRSPWINKSAKKARKEVRKYKLKRIKNFYLKKHKPSLMGDGKFKFDCKLIEIVTSEK